MKPFKIYTSLIILALGFACQDDTERVIDTSLPAEAMQLFDLSRILGESTPLLAYSFSDFGKMDSTSLPGSPKIEIDSVQRKVTLNFDQAQQSEEEPVNIRSGKIIISYLNASQSTYQTIEYDQYKLGKYQLVGTRNFKQITLSEFTESFDELALVSEDELTYEMSGEFSHSISRSDFRVQSLMITGNLSGRNAVGRKIKLSISSPKVLSLDCFERDQILPLAGSETWQVDRGENKEVNHTLTFENELGCTVLAFAQLPDGRRLQLNN